MAELTCGSGGSTSQEVITQINTNTENTEDLLALSFFEYDAQQDILDVPETYTALASIDVADMAAGVYMVTVSMTYTYDSTNTSAFLQMTLNGNSEIFQREPKDNTDRQPLSYTFPYNHAADGPFTLLTEARKETSANTLDVLFANATVERKA